MKKSVHLLLAVCLYGTTLPAQDTPNPPANLQTLPAGSYIIPMDNTLQLNTSSKFNLKAYGLVVHLLNNNIRVKWVIRSGKLKDETDFTALAEPFRPVYIAGGNSTAFRSAPFVIFPADTTGVSSLVNSYYTSQGLTGNDRPRVYRTTTATAGVDIRYDMNGFIPKAAILTDGGNQKIHRDFMIAAGITNQNYKEVAAVTLSDCYTFASEPHNDESGAALDAIVASIRTFVLSGRNFLAECAAIRTYENNPFGKFHTPDGFIDANEKTGTNITYHHPDLSYYQFDGAWDGSVGGSLQNWTIAGSLSNPAAYSKATGSGSFAGVQSATVSKLISGQGGLVFYLGNHDFKNNVQEEINGIRMYLNAFMTPANPAVFCGTVLPVKLSNFTGFLNNNKVTLQWTVQQNESADRFEVERSDDAVHFRTAGLVFSTSKTGTEQYPYTESLLSPKSYYRLKMMDKSGAVNYSAIVMLQQGTGTGPKPVLAGNPVTDQLRISLPGGNEEKVTVRLLDMTGRQLLQQSFPAAEGNSQLSLPLPASLNRGVYIADIIRGAQHTPLKFYKQ